MKAEEAAPILNELDDETVILIFSKMEEERVAKIMTLLEPRRSARLSDAMLKGRVTS
jgi:flagellar motility protein MotE (MotC chaperone)